jgi:hypothetical protein
VAASSLSVGEIVVNDFLSFEGFVNMSYVHSEADGGSDIDSESENSFEVEELEISWLFDFEPVTARIDIQYEGNRRVAATYDDDADRVYIEQAFATYELGDGGAVTAGRYESMLGFEAREPSGLYQYSTAYTSSITWGGWKMAYLPTYAQGVKYTRQLENGFWGVSVQDSAFTVDEGRLGGSGESSYAIELAGQIDYDNGLSYFVGGVFEDGSEGDAYVLNTYVTLDLAAWILAAELNYADKDENSDAFDESGYGLQGLSGLVMANFAYSEDASVTGRLSFADNDWTNYSNEFTLKYTFAHNYAFTDNLLLVTELSYADYDYEDDSDDDEDELSFAVELRFTF